MAERRQVRLGLIGLGEVGFNLAKGLRGEGLEAICTHDSAASGAAFGDLIRARAQDASVDLVTELAELAERSDIILGLTPGSQSIASAEALAGFLTPGHLYVDLASTTPKVKIAAMERVQSSGAAIDDGSLMGAPLIDGHRIEILTSGPAAQAFRDALAPWGMNITDVGAKLGSASGIKIFRSVIAKGLEALLVECLMASEQHGISDDVLQSYGRFLAPHSFAEMANFLVCTDVIHAKRRADEAAMSAEALRDAGVEPVMTEATVARLRSVADLQLKTVFNGQVPKHYRQAIAAISDGLLTHGGS